MLTPNQKINLLLYVGAQSVYGGNLIASLRCLADYVRSRGGKVIWMFPVGASERDWFKSLAQDEDVETYDRSLGFIPRARQLRKTISKKQINVVHIHFSDIAVPLAASFGKNVRIVRHVHSDFTLGHTETGRREFIKRAKDCVLDVVQMFTGKAVNICVSPFLASQFKGAYVPNAIAPSHIRQVSIDEMRKKRIEVGVKATDTCVLMFGWSPLVKGLDIAVDAVERLNECVGGGLCS